MAIGILGVLAASLVSSVLSAYLQYNTALSNQWTQRQINTENVNAQQSVNAQNIAAQKEINQQNIDYSREFAQNGIQWKMEDLKAAGLNPVMAAGLNGSVSPTTMVAPTAKAPYQQAPQLDMSGVGSALNAMTNMMYASYFMNQRNENYADRTDAIMNRNNPYARNAAMVNSSKQIQSVVNEPQKSLKASGNEDWEKDWDQFLKALKRGKFK